MKMSEMLKKWLIAECGVKADAADDGFTKAAGEAFANGKLTAEKYLEMTRDPVNGQANHFQKQMDQIADVLSKLVGGMTKQVKEPEKKEELQVTKDVKTADIKDLDKTIAKIADSDLEDKAAGIRVKEAVERYSDTKSAAVYPQEVKGFKHPLAGQPMTSFSEDGHVIMESSQRDKAVIGAWSKFLAAAAASGNSRTLGYMKLPEHDKELLQHALTKMEWSGHSGVGDSNYADIRRRKLTPHEQKAIIDDAVSGGLEAAPIVFDDIVIQAPLLSGQLFPLVNRVPLTRGRRVEGVAISRVTGSWGGVDDTAITLFNTASYVAAFDTTIYRWQGAIRIGLDFLSDSPINFGQTVTQQYGEALLNDLDDVVATGNGTTQPEGIMTKAGTTSVAWGGATSIGNYESMLSSIAEEEYGGAAAGSVVFCGTQTSYYRAKAIPVGAADARRLFGEGGMGTQGYRNFRLMDFPYKLNSSMANNQIFFAVLARYRMYQREGLTMKSSTEGDTLIRNNEMLMVAMARYGGQLERGACAAVTSTAPA